MLHLNHGSDNDPSGRTGLSHNCLWCFISFWEFIIDEQKETLHCELIEHLKYTYLVMKNGQQSSILDVFIWLYFRVVTNTCKKKIDKICHFPYFSTSLYTTYDIRKNENCLKIIKFHLTLIRKTGAHFQMGFNIIMYKYLDYSIE